MLLTEVQKVNKKYPRENAKELLGFP